MGKMVIEFDNTPVTVQRNDALPSLLTMIYG